jgi:uncharacterized protein (DUF1501 family)
MGTAWRETVVAMITEFGRTARINGTEGTDHGSAKFLSYWRPFMGAARMSAFGGHPATLRECPLADLGQPSNLTPTMTRMPASVMRSTASRARVAR